MVMLISELCSLAGSGNSQDAQMRGYPDYHMGPGGPPSQVHPPHMPGPGGPPMRPGQYHDPNMPQQVNNHLPLSFDITTIYYVALIFPCPLSLWL